MTVLLCGTCVAWAWALAEKAIIPNCATAVDFLVTATTLDVLPRSHQRWAVDAQVRWKAEPELQVARQGLQTPKTRESEAASNAFETVARPVVRAQADCPSLQNKRLLLRWTGEDPPKIGQSFVATVKLKAPWGQANPGAFDYRRWLLAEGFAGTGYVRRVHYLEEGAELPTRSRLARYFRSTLSDLGLVRPEVLQALVTGDGGYVTPQIWEVYRLSGTIHLLVISGLHVSVLSVMLFALLLFPLRLLGLHRRRDIPALTAASMVCAGALWVGWFSGAGSPVMRVATMLLAMFVLKLTRRSSSIWSVLVLSALLTSFAMPLQIFRSGFWLSYGAVAVLLFFFLPRRPRASALSGGILVQLVLFIGLSPLAALVVGESALVALPGNYLAVPILTLVTVPCLFIGLGVHAISDVMSGVPSFVLASIANPILHLADFSVLLIETLLIALLDIVPQRSVSIGYVNVETALAALIGGLIALLPLSAYARIGAFSGLLALGLQTSAGVPVGEFCIRVIDVGQGSAALIDTARHRLLVDTGPGFETRNLARSQILPMLRSTGKHDLDLMLLSHTDLDHAGGLDFFRDYFKPVPELGPDNCPHNKDWSWDGVRFTTLQASDLQTDNDRSCTLLVQAEASKGEKTAFFSGDISSLAEEALLPRLPPTLAFLLAPHHGSASSSSMPFVRHIAPLLVVYSAAKDSRYGHPHPRVVRRYQWEESRQLNTGFSGAIQWCSASPSSVRQHRGTRD
jgi:competence protein ComEC